MDIKVTFKIETRLSDEKIKQSFIDDFIWPSDDMDSIDVWSPALHILGGCNANDSNEPHIVYIDIEYDPDIIGFDELATFIKGELESKELGHPRFVEFFALDCSAGSFEKSEPKKNHYKNGTYYFSIEHVRDGLSLDDIKKMISNKLNDEYGIISSIFEDAPKFKSVDVFDNGSDGADVDICAPCEFFEWLGFQNLNKFVKENIEKPEEIIKHSCTFNETTSTGGFEVVFKTNDRNEFENVKEVVSNMVDYKED